MFEKPPEHTPEREHRIRDRAHHLWEADGCPEGRAQEHWERAQSLIDDEEHDPSVPPGEVPQADVAAEREVAARAGNQQQPATPQEKKDR